MKIHQFLLALMMMLPAATGFCSVAVPDTLRLDGDWRITEGDGGAYVHREETERGVLTRIGLQSGGVYTISTRVPASDKLYQAFSFRFYTPGNVPDGVELIFHIKDVDFWWYQKLLQKRPKPGKWVEYTIPLYETDEMVFDYPARKYNWVSRGHLRPFDPTVLRKMREVGITLRVPALGSRKRRPARSERTDGPPSREFILADTSFRTSVTEKPELRITDLKFPTMVPQYEKFEASFDLTRCYTNPFDPETVNVTARVTTPSGKSFEYPCFYFQNYIRKREGEFEKLIPLGAPCWKLRIAPLERGKYTWRISARDGDSVTSTSERNFVASKPVSKGFVRVSEKDPVYFEFSNGSFFYPIGLSLHCTYDDRFHNITQNKGLTEVRDHPGDTRTAEGGYIIDRRSYFHTDAFDKMKRNKMNATEIWLASWGYEIEWNGDWKGYGGTNQYNMENAWRLDLVTDSARKNDVYFNLVFHCHGQFSKGEERGQDGEFAHHPYNRANGGFLYDPYQIFYNKRAFLLLMKRMRYVVARYGYSRNIFGWEIISETDLTSARVSGASRSLVLRYTDQLKTVDVHRHPVTNHYSHNYTITDVKLMRDRRMDFITGDAYRGWVGYGRPFHYAPFYELLKLSSEYWNTFAKPSLVTECGCSWFGGPEYAMTNDVHQTCWAAWMTHLAGTPFFWWAEHVEGKDLYWHYKAFARYVEGEDKRGRGLEMNSVDINVSGGEGPELTAVTLTNKEGGYAWIYDIKEYDIWTTTTERNGVYNDRRKYAAPLYSDVHAPIDGLSPGKYHIEVWDTYKGEVVDTVVLESRRGSISVPLPPFRKDIALKIKPAS